MTVITTITILLLNFDVFFPSIVAVFINKITKKIILRILLLSLVLLLGLSIGSLIGNKISSFTQPLNYWYSATILFLLSIKLMYSGLKMQKHKQSININDKLGLVLLIFTISLNSLLCGTAFGLINSDFKIITLGLIVSLITIILSILIGVKVKKIYAIKYDLISAVGFLLLAIIIISKHL